MSFESLVQLTEYRGMNDSERIFLSSTEHCVDVSYGLFYENAKALAQHLQERGLSKGQRVAIILDNGLNWVVAFWSVLMAGGVVVPLNPRFKVAETVGLLEQADAQLIITDLKGVNAVPSEFVKGTEEPFPAVSKGDEALLVIMLHPEKQVESELEFTLICSEDEALLLFTSGSSGVPKGVVLTHANLLAAADNIQQAHQLTAADTVLCILPFFHANGLIITLITSVFSGSRVVVPPKFSASKFWEWANRYQVTWFSAVPTILSILLSNGNNEVIPHSLRFARSASASLPVAVLNEFEQRYKIPVIESYGMTEASSQITTNPLPPVSRKAGSVGRAVGNIVDVIDERGSVVLPGETGEVVIKGGNVTPGYLNNSEANREAFKNGWFHTGDMGYFDEDGYLFLTGRQNELINRAGEKFSPREVDEILYQISEIETAAAVGVPDPLFGEEVVAFIQLRPGLQLSEEQVIAHCKACLVDYKVPKRIYYINNFPKGPSGKVQRRLLLKLFEDII